MYTFLLYIGTDIDEIERALRVSAERTLRVAPEHFAGSTSQFRLLPECKTGWFILHPSEEVARPYVSEYVDESVVILAFGVPADGSEMSMAKIVAHAWMHGGLMNVRRQDSAFSVVLIDRNTNKTYIISDQLGLRSIQYFIDGYQLWISPHDVPIVAASSCSLEINALSVYSIFRTGWSLQGVPLLTDLHVTDPKYYYTWEHGVLSKHQDHILTGVERLDPHDDIGKSENLEELISHLNKSVATIIQGHDCIDLDLTAGWDTRTIAALLLHNAGQIKLRAYTSGKASDIECQTARWFAEYYGFDHYRNGPHPSLPDQVERSVAAHAFYTNGQGSSWREFHTRTYAREMGVPHFTGHNTGSIKALYYPNKFVTRPSAGSEIDIEKELVPGTIRIQIEFHSRELEVQLEQQVLDIIQEYLKISTHPHDMLDLFAIYERIGRFAATDCEVRFPNVTNRYCLFESPTFVRIASQMHPPMSQAFALQRRIIKRYTPRSFYTLFNDRIFAPTMTNRYLGQFSKMVFEARVLVKKRLPMYQPTMEEQRMQVEIDKNLMNYASERMQDKQGLLSTVFNITELSELIRIQTAPDGKQRAILGHVIGLETWYRQIKAARGFNPPLTPPF